MMFSQVRVMALFLFPSQETDRTFIFYLGYLLVF